MAGKFSKAIDFLKTTWISRAGLQGDPRLNNILDIYAMSSPGSQNAVDIFKGEWMSKLPDPDIEAGSLLLFEDARLAWFMERLGGIEGKTVLELGPLEAGHSYMMETGGARSVLSIEANTRAYLKCLIIKEIFQLRKVRFLAGDFMAYLRETTDRFDIGVASGVLYHMTNPIELISRLAETTRHLYLWTHYCDPETTYYTSKSQNEYGGFEHTLYRRLYGGALKDKQFCGGGEPFSNWLSREDLMDGLRHFGFDIKGTAFDLPDHPNGPSISIYAVVQEP